MAKEFEDRPITTPKVAFVLNRIVSNPKDYLQADPERGGLSEIGQRHYTQELLEKMSPCFATVARDPQIENQAHQYKEQLRKDMERGTVAVSLNTEERELFDTYIQAIYGSADPFLRNLISTRFTL